MPRLRVKGLTLSEYQTNGYIVWETASGACWIIDAPEGSERLVEEARALGLTPTALLLTHAHLDHLAGARVIHAAWPRIEIAVHPAEKAWLTDAHLNMSAFMGRPVTSPPATRMLNDGDVLTLGALKWRVIHVPGHSPGSVAFYCEQAGAGGVGGVAVAGDALFKDSIGRTDLREGSHEQLIESIRTRLFTLPDETQVLPGHGPATTIGRERRMNPFLQD